jgi:hypothetical protein
MACLLLVFIQGISFEIIAYANTDYVISPYQAHEARLDRWGFFTKFDSIEDLIQNIIYFLSYVVGALALLGLFVGGGMIIFGGAMEGMLEKGKDVIVYSIIGLAVAVLSYAITTFVTTILYSIE